MINTVIGVGRFPPTEILLPKIPTVSTAVGNGNLLYSSESCESAESSRSAERSDGSRLISTVVLPIKTTVTNRPTPAITVTAQLRLKLNSTVSNTTATDGNLNLNSNSNTTVNPSFRNRSGVINFRGSTSIIDAIEQFETPAGPQTSTKISIHEISLLPTVMQSNGNRTTVTESPIDFIPTLLTSRGLITNVTDLSSRLITSPAVRNSNDCAVGQLFLIQIFCLVCMLLQAYVSIFGSRMRNRPIRWMVLQYSILNATYIIFATFSPPFAAPITQCLSTFVIFQTLAGLPIFRSYFRRNYAIIIVFALNVSYYALTALIVAAYDRVDNITWIFFANLIAWMILVFYIVITVIRVLSAGFDSTVQDATRRVIYYASLMSLCQVWARDGGETPSTVGLPLAYAALTVILVRMYREQYINLFACRDVYRQDVHVRVGSILNAASERPFSRRDAPETTLSGGISVSRPQPSLHEIPLPIVDDKAGIRRIEEATCRAARLSRKRTDEIAPPPYASRDGNRTKC